MGIQAAELEAFLFGAAKGGEAGSLFEHDGDDDDEEDAYLAAAEKVRCLRISYEAAAGTLRFFPA